MTDLVAEPEPEPAPTKRSPLPIILGLLAVVALIVGVIVIAADGDEPGTDDPVTLIGSAPDAAREAGTARLTITMAMSGGDMPVNLDIDGEGVVDFVSGDSTFEMSMFGMDLEMRFLDSTMYTRMPDGRWAAMPVTMAGGATGSFAPNGASFLETLRGVSDDVDEIGSQQVNGEDAHGYRATIDPSRALEKVPEEYRDQVDASLAQMGEIGMDVLPVEIWVTEGGLPVRMVMAFTTDLFDMKMTMDYTDFGLDVDVEKPRAEDIVTVEDPTELQELMMGAGAPK